MDSTQPRDLECERNHHGPESCRVQNRRWHPEDSSVAAAVGFQACVKTGASIQVNVPRGEKSPRSRLARPVRRHATSFRNSDSESRVAEALARTARSQSPSDWLSADNLPGRAG